VFKQEYRTQNAGYRSIRGNINLKFDLCFMLGYNSVMFKRLNKNLIALSFLLISAASLIFISCKRTSQSGSGLSEKLSLKILYAGEKGTTRFNDFETFLKTNFKTVTAIDLKSFDQNQTRDCDVVILDSNGIGRGSFPVSFSKDYSKPTISMGIPGARWCDEMHLKTGYS